MMLVHNSHIYLFTEAQLLYNSLLSLYMWVYQLSQFNSLTPRWPLSSSCPEDYGGILLAYGEHKRILWLKPTASHMPPCLLKTILATIQKPRGGEKGQVTHTTYEQWCSYNRTNSSYVTVQTVVEFSPEACTVVNLHNLQLVCEMALLQSQQTQSWPRPHLIFLWIMHLQKKKKKDLALHSDGMCF